LPAAGVDRLPLTLDHSTGGPGTARRSTATGLGCVDGRKLNLLKEEQRGLPR